MPDAPYRAPMPVPPDPPDPYAVAWADLGRRRRVLDWLSFAGVPAAFAVAFASGQPGCAMAMFGLLGAFLVVARKHADAFSCPRCGRTFTSSPKEGNGTLTWCSHCALRIGTRKSAIIEAEKRESAALRIAQAAGGDAARVASRPDGT